MRVALHSYLIPVFKFKREKEELWSYLKRGGRKRATQMKRR